MYLVFTRKFSDTYWKLLGWIVYISMVAISVWFTWGVLDKFAKKETAVRQYEDNIDAHPTIAICCEMWKSTPLDYQKTFKFIYKIYQSGECSDEVVLKIGDNDLENSRGTVNLTVMYTGHNFICWAIKTTQKVDDSEIEIKLWSPYGIYANVFITSEKNSYGIIKRNWMDGEPFYFQITTGIRKDITMTVEKNINLKCSQESFYEYLASKLSDQSFETCNERCLMTSLPNNPYPICPNYSKWYMDKEVKESNCNWKPVKDLIQNITSNNEHLKTCITTQYSGIIQEHSGKDAEFKYKFALPLKAKVYEEYFIIDAIGLIGSVGGTLGVFIGFSFNNLIICIIGYIQSLIERKQTPRKKISTETIRKCLEWIIYLSLVATAILFAKEVIEKFFGQNKGIKQSIEKIETHPTVTICPFLYQCDGQYKFVLRLQDLQVGATMHKEWVASYAGSYTNLSPERINGQLTFTHTHDVNRVMWYCSRNREWQIGPRLDIGTCNFAFFKSKYSILNDWHYWNDGHWNVTAPDVVVEKGLPSLCIKDAQNYGTEFNITYQTFKSDGLTPEEKISLEFGENQLSFSKEKVGLTIIHTRWNTICYKINTTRNVDFRKTEIKLNTSGSKILETSEFFFTSEENAYGITNNKFMDGKAFATQLNGGNLKEINLFVEKNIHLACRKESFFEFVASRLSKSKFENCTQTCLRTSLPNEHYPICPNFEDLYTDVLKGSLTEPENDCNWGIVRDLIKYIITGDEYLRICETIDYSGKIIAERNDQESNELRIQYNFAFPLMAKVYQEFLLIDTIDLVGSVGGTIGLFIGFSFNNLMTFIIGSIQAFLSSRKKMPDVIWVIIGWILYLSLMATSIWFAWGVYYNYMKHTEIQQHEVEIESHPTITICPFLDQCAGQMKFILKLDGEIKKRYAIYEGTYSILSSDLINSRPYWIHKHDGNKALLYNIQTNMWVFGPKDKNGKVGDIMGKPNGVAPYEVTKWYYRNNEGHWNFTTTDVFIDLGLSLRLYGEPKKIEYLAIYEGIYNISSYLTNGKPYWTEDKHEANKALWYNAIYKLWLIGPTVNIGSNAGFFYSQSTVPYGTTKWYYWNNGYWNSTTTDVVIEGVTSLCMTDLANHGTDFNVTYQTYKNNGLTSDEKVPLEIGENLLAVSKEKVTMTKIFTRWHGTCYKINTTRKVDFRKTEIKLKTSLSCLSLATTEFFFTSEDNSYGVTNNKFMDGKFFSTHLDEGKWKEIYLSVEKNINLACNKESFYEYVESRLSERNFESCTDTCLQTSLPNERYPICSNYEDWYGTKGNLTELEDDCNWGIIKDLIKEIITEGERLRTCVTADYYRLQEKTMTEEIDGKSNELGIQYIFASPLRAIVYQEFLIIDTMELVGSLGHILGLFIGFAFSIGCIVAFLTTRKKLHEAIWTSMRWIFYLLLMATSVWFAWGVLDKFFKQDTGIQQHEREIETHPTIIICLGSPKYGTALKIEYNSVDLDIGENYMKTLKDVAVVNLTTVYTRYHGLCYAINTSRKIDEETTAIKIMPKSSTDNLPGTIPVIFTSEMNSYGITQRDWRDGEYFSFITSAGHFKGIQLTVEKNINLKCSDQSFYEYVASRLSEDILEECNSTCLMTSLPNDPYPICPNYDEWYGNDTKEKEANCNWNTLKELILNITTHEEHLKTCITTQYLGKITAEIIGEHGKYAEIKYNFALPLEAMVYEEYLITDGTTLIGSVGGTLGLFIGFSISNIVYSIMDFLQSKTNCYNPFAYKVDLNFLN